MSDSVTLAVGINFIFTKLLLIFQLIMHLLNFNMGVLFRASLYVNDRMPFKAKFIDTSWLKIGRQLLPSRIGPLFSNITFNWIDPLISDDFLRKVLKKDFFKE